jgi:hypothetical protein
MGTTRDPPPLCWRKDSLQDFRIAYQNVFGEDIEGEELEHAARYLLNLYKSVYSSPREIINLNSNDEQEKN